MYGCVCLSSVCDISPPIVVSRLIVNFSYVYLQGHDLILLFGFAFFFCVLQPFDELLHLLQEVHLTLV